MTDRGNDIDTLTRRVREGELQAVVELIQRYEEMLRRMLQMHARVSLRAKFDSQDVYQSVMGDFLARYQAGSYRFESEQQLIQLFSQLMLHKLLDKARMFEAAKRDRRREISDSEAAANVPDNDDSPSQIISARELFQEVLRQLTPEERAVAERRFNGEEWDSIAESCGSEADAARKRLARGLKRVADNLGINTDA